MGTLRQASKILSLFEETAGDQIQALLESGLLADLRDGNIAEVKRDNFRKILGLKSLNPSLLELVGTVTVPAISPFIAREKFVVDTSKGAHAKVAYLGDNFKAWFLEKIEKPIAETVLRYAKLTRWALDDEIRKEIGAEREETTLSQIYTLLKKQPNGEPGVLLSNGYANIFYVNDAGGILRAVRVHWRGDGWYVYADFVTDPGGWRVGYQVFSRNSLVTLTL